MTKEMIERSRKRHEFADAALIVTTITLVVSLVIAVTAVSIGIARADTLVPIADSGVGRFALALFLGFLIAAVGALTAAMVRRDRTAPQRRD
jgi:hypothetical protein